MTDLVKLYNPANAAALTPKDIEGLKNLTSDQIKELAKAYPNHIFPAAYLLIIDTKSKVPVEKQIPALSTFGNLWNLREKNGLKGYVPIGFRGQQKQRVTNVRPKRSEVVDLSDAELMTLPGFKLAKTNGGTEVIAPEVVPVKKVMKKETFENIEKAVVTEPVKRGRPKKIN